MATFKVGFVGGEAKESTSSIRDVYTDTDGNLVLRFEGDRARISLVLYPEELALLKQGIADNIRLRPEQHYQVPALYPDGSYRHDPTTGIPLPEGVKRP